jgi:hypothetical protein
VSCINETKWKTGANDDWSIPRLESSSVRVSVTINTASLPLSNFNTTQNPQHTNKQTNNEGAPREEKKNTIPSLFCTFILFAISYPFVLIALAFVNVGGWISQQ